MADYFTSQKEKLSFREICLGHLKRILEISTVEFRSGYLKTIFRDGASWEEYVPSSMRSYAQAVEHFAYALVPHFDKEMEKTFDEFLEEAGNLTNNLIEKRKKRITDNFEFEVRKAEARGRVPPEKIELEENLRKAITLGSKEDQQITLNRLDLCEGLFVDLNRLLKRIDYLKSSVYSESDLDKDNEEDSVVDMDEKEK